MSRKSNPPAPPGTLTLADLPRLGRGWVVRVRGDGLLSDRLRELGFSPGTEVVFLRRAPLGDPLLVRLRGTELCLRRTEAARVEIAAGAPQQGGAAAPEAS